MKFGFLLSEDEARNQMKAYEILDPGIIRIPRVYRYFTDSQGYGYLVMDYMEGEKKNAKAAGAQLWETSSSCVIPLNCRLINIQPLEKLRTVQRISGPLSASPEQYSFEHLMRATRLYSSSQHTPVCMRHVVGKLSHSKPLPCLASCSASSTLDQHSTLLPAPQGDHLSISPRASLTTML